MRLPDTSVMSAEERLAYYTRRIEWYLDPKNRHRLPNYLSPTRCKKWASRACHAAFQLHPDLRPEENHEKYVEGKRRGLRGRELSRFINC